METMTDMKLMMRMAIVTKRATSQVEMVKNRVGDQSLAVFCLLGKDEVLGSGVTGPVFGGR